MLEIKNLAKSYDTRTIFKNMNLTVNDGEVLSIVGPSGTGGGFGGFGGGFSMEDIFSQFGDIFGGHFSGGSYRTSSSGGRRVSRGTDIRVRVKLSLADPLRATLLPRP